MKGRKEEMEEGSKFNILDKKLEEIWKRKN